MRLEERTVQFGDSRIYGSIRSSTDRTLFFVASKRDETAMVELLVFLEQTLTEDEWALLKAYFLDGIPLDELAAQMGITPNNLRVEIPADHGAAQ